MKPEALSIDVIRTDCDTQSRLAITEDTVEDYAEQISASNDWPFPPLDVFHDGNQYYLSEGFHRLLGAKRAKRASVPCNVHKGTAKDARIFAMTANDKNGLRLSRADKKSNVLWLLALPEKMTQAEIADKAGVSRRFVQQIVADQKPKVVPQQPPPVATKAHGAPFSGDSGGCDDITEPDIDDSFPPQDAVDAAPTDKCPNCAGRKWVEDDEGWCCAKCSHPYGEPAGDVDEDRLATQRSKTVKTAEALMRCFDDLQVMLAKPLHAKAVDGCKSLIQIARGWK